MLINARTAFAARVADNSVPETADFDSYMTPPEAIRALIHIEGARIPQVIWEPMCGTGNIVTALRESGRTCYASDIFDYGFPGCKIEDYRTAVPEWDVEAIVTNPPFTFAPEFAEKSLREAPYVAYFLRTNFLESQGRFPFFKEHPPARVWVFSRRLPMMHRHGWTGKQAASNVCYAWFVFDARSDTKKVLGWIDWKTLATA
jgi:hypothetical protein